MRDCFVRSIGKYCNEEYPMSDYQILYNFLNSLCDWINKTTNANNNGNRNNIILNGNEIVAMLNEVCNLNGSNYYTIMDSLNSIVPPRDIMNLNNNKNNKNVKGKNKSLNLEESLSIEELSYNMISKESLNFLEKMGTILKYLYVIENMNCFRLVIDNRYNIISKKVELYMSILCMDPCVLFNDLSSKCHSIILASGTLAPLSTFKSELNCNFPITLESQHVINASKQLRVYSISNYNGLQLCLTKENVHSFEYIDALGNIILKLCNHIPDGVLCFVPSYKSLDEMKSRWENTGLYKELNKVKKIFFESRSGNINNENLNSNKNFNKLINDYRDCICNNNMYKIYNNNGDVDDGEVDNNNNKSVKCVGGGIIFGVYRGKISEGIDFSDDYCRSVIAIGIPYQNYGSYDVSLKLKYQDEMKREILSSRDWYSQDAFRSINQAVGRCIRHKNDYGSIILIDKRYNDVVNEKMLCKWYSKYLIKNLENEKMLSELDEFYLNVEKNINEMNKVEKEKSEKRKVERDNIEKENLQNSSLFSPSPSPSLSLSSPSSLSPSLSLSLSTSIRINNKRKRENNNNKENIDKKYSDLIKEELTQYEEKKKEEEKLIINEKLYLFKCKKCNEVIEISNDKNEIEEIDENAKEDGNHYIIQLFNELLKSKAKERLYIIKHECESINEEKVRLLNVNVNMNNINDKYNPKYSDVENLDEMKYSVYDIKDEYIYSPIFCKSCEEESLIGAYNDNLKELKLYVKSLKLNEMNELNEYYERIGKENGINEIDNSLKDNLSFIFNQSSEEIYSALCNMMKDEINMRNKEMKFYSLFMKDLLNYRSLSEIFEENDVIERNENGNVLKKRKLS